MSHSPTSTMDCSISAGSAPFNVFSKAAKNCCIKRVMGPGFSISRIMIASALVKDRLPMITFSIIQESGLVFQKFIV